MAKIVIVSFSKTKLKIQLSPKLTKNLIDWNIHQGRLLLNIFGSLAEFERDIIRERTKAGLSAAKAGAEWVEKRRD